MPAEQIIALLIAERDKLNRAIEALQGPAKRRGRPPKNPLATSAAAPAPKKHGRRFSAAQRKAASERMRLRWAAKKKVGAKATALQPTTKKRTMSAAGRKAIRDAVRKRWALIRAGKAASPFAKRKAEAKVAKKAVSKSKKAAKAA